MRYTKQLEGWIHETVDYYLFIMHSRYWLSPNIKVIVKRKHMPLLEKDWKKWAEERGLEPFEPISYDVDEDDNNLAELQDTIVHQLIHLESDDTIGIEHGPFFDALTEMFQLPEID